MAEAARQGLKDQPPFWSIPEEELLKSLDARSEGLSSEAADERRERFGVNSLKPRHHHTAAGLILAQFKSPLTLILLAAAVVSFFLGDHTDAIIILAIVIASSLLGFAQEYSASNAVERLLAAVRVTTRVRRDGKEVEIPIEQVVPGDISVLNAGDTVPGDSRLLEAKDLFANESALTGESYPVEKSVSTVAADAALSGRTNSLFMGTHVVSGTALAVIVHTARATELGRVSSRLQVRPPETEFESGVRRFGLFLMTVTAILVVAIFVVNVALKRPLFDSFLFSVALAVGLTPQLLPAIISINLSKGAQRMAKSQVIVKRLVSIENFGSMSVLCSDKTGTLTLGQVRLQSALDPEGRPSDDVLLYAYLNAAYQTGFNNPLDSAILSSAKPDISRFAKLDEVPYNFERKRLSVLAAQGERHFLITKGALTGILDICTQARKSDGSVVPLDQLRTAIEQRYEEAGKQGLRVIGLAVREDSGLNTIRKEDETGMTFLGLLQFADPVKPDIIKTVKKLSKKGIRLKLITGDNRLVAQAVGSAVGLQNPSVLAGPDMKAITDEALPVLVDDVDIFAEIEPNQKERIIRALMKAGHVVGFLGDGINDATALRAADVGISVESAVDVAKEAADIVLLKKELSVLVDGVDEGRATFNNTLKYVFMATSANFGNMFSMAGASLFLPFLPLLPTQVLLTNLLTDFPEMTIATDRVDPESVTHPHRWDLRFIRRFMVSFGLLSSVFDFLTFGALLLVFRAGQAEFRTGWFVESVISAALIVLVIRTRRPFFRSLPGRWLLIATLGVVAATLALPWTPLGRVFGFVPLPPHFLLLLAGIIALYILSAELRKRGFYHSRPESTRT